MAYSEVGVVNLAFSLIGEDAIDAAEWAAQTEQKTINAYAVWEYIRDEVLEAADWAFAKTRTTLSKIPPMVDLNCGDLKHLYVKAVAGSAIDETKEISIDVETNTSDALSVALDSNNSKNIQIRLANATATKNTVALIQTALQALSTVNTISVAAWTVTGNAEYVAVPPTTDVDIAPRLMAATLPGLYFYGYLLPDSFLRVPKSKEYDKSVKPIWASSATFDEYSLLRLREQVYHYVIETLDDDTKILLINFDDASYPLDFTYIRKVTDATKWTAHFINTLATRLAAQLSLVIPEDPRKFINLMSLYKTALNDAKGLNQSSDYLEDETGSDSWVEAGRA